MREIIRPWLGSVPAWYALLIAVCAFVTGCVVGQAR
jgi:hypothetical protein